ncbi:MAG TPA: GMC family oxidoreductase N-terminal domain-containing protein [Acidimicrobiia bacterium]|nr:GMC family oxidoreductase N-terminal domain-containing protein [Acidimicrobiia bacterium]
MSSAADIDVADYVVIGGGAAGSVVAGRLAEAGAEVILLEAGGTDRRPDVLIPAGAISVYRTCNWSYVPEPDPSRHGAVEAWSSGKVLGGGGSINAMVFVRGHRADYDEWASLGCVGWDYESVLPYFKKLETWAGGASEYRGGTGPIHVSFHGMDHPANAVFLEAAEQAGYPVLDDYNAATPEGAGAVQVNQKRGTRSNAPRGYLRGLTHRGRLTIRTKAYAHRIVFEGDRAAGVEYISRGRPQAVRARREVVLSTGALVSPKVLMLSGIGPRDELGRFGIDVRHESSGVGSNLQEHPGFMLRWHSRLRTINEMRPREALGAVADYVRTGRGPFAATVFHAQVMHRTDPDLARPNIQILLANYATSRERGADGILKIRPARTSGLMACALLVHPRVRGRILLRSTSPLDAPVIRHPLLADPADVADLLAGMEEARRIMDQPAAKEVVGGLFDPEARRVTRADWEAELRENVTYAYHHVGTCRMGTSADCVVDPQLRVRGVEGLRVVDASIMPTIPTGNTNAVSMMIGEKGADLILNRSPA